MSWVSRKAFEKSCKYFKSFMNFCFDGWNRTIVSNMEYILQQASFLFTMFFKPTTYLVIFILYQLNLRQLHKNLYTNVLYSAAIYSKIRRQAHCSVHYMNFSTAAWQSACVIWKWLNIWQGPKGMPDQEISVQNKDKQPKNLKK